MSIKLCMFWAGVKGTKLSQHQTRYGLWKKVVLAKIGPKAICIKNEVPFVWLLHSFTFTISNKNREFSDIFFKISFTFLTILKCALLTFNIITVSLAKKNKLKVSTRREVKFFRRGSGQEQPNMKPRFQDKSQFSSKIFLCSKSVFLNFLDNWKWKAKEFQMYSLNSNQLIVVFLLYYLLVYIIINVANDIIISSQKYLCAVFNWN